MQVSDEEKILLARGEDTVRLASKQYSVKALGFLTPAEAVFLEKNIKATVDVKTMFYGGYEECERTLFVAMPEFFEEEYTGHGLTFNEKIKVVCEEFERVY